jgi:LysM repeat protein
MDASSQQLTPDRPAVEAELVDRMRDVCPYLLSAGGRWRMATPTREHRCAAVAPPAPLTMEKQRRLCLVQAHNACATYLAALTNAQRADPARATRWGFARTAPVIFETRRVLGPLSQVTGGRAAAQVGLVGLMVVAFGAVAVGRIADQEQASVLDATVTPASSPIISAAPPSPTPRATATPSTSPSAAASAASSPPLSASPAPASPTAPSSPSPVANPAAASTYTVQTGDTLSAIATRFSTTVQAIQQANGLGTSTIIRRGQVLQIPSR